MRDYCPSRHEQEKLKPKKVRQRSWSKKSRQAGQKIGLALVSFLVLVLFLALTFYLFRQQWLKTRQLDRAVVILLLNESRPQAILQLQPQEKRVRVYTFADLSRDTWPTEDIFTNPTGVLTNFSAKLFYSYFFHSMVEQVFTYPTVLQAEVESASLQAFLLEQLKGVEGGALAAWLQQPGITWLFETAQDWAELDTLLQRTASAPPPIYDCPLAVINTTRQPGLASRFANILELSGFSIIRRDNLAEDINTSYLVLDQENAACQLLLQRWQIFQPQVESQKNSLITQEYRAGAVLFLGQDLIPLNVAFTQFFHGNL